MSNHDRLTTEERALEVHLRRLTPQAHRLQRDALMFEAGRRDGRTRARWWQGASAALFLSAAWLGFIRGHPLPTTEPPPLLVHAPPPSAHVSESAQTKLASTEPRALEAVSDNLRWRERFLREGADALPTPSAYSAWPDPPETVAGWYRGSARPWARAFFPVQRSSHGDRS